MARIAFLLADDYEDSEFRKPYDAVTAAGHEVVIFGIEAGATVRGKTGDDSAVVAERAADGDVENFDAVVVPGGYSPDKLRTDRGAVEFVRAAFERDMPVAAICHAPQLLIEADVLRGRTLTSWASVRRDVENAGGKWVDREVVLDGNLITSRKPDDLDAFCKRLLESVESR